VLCRESEQYGLDLLAPRLALDRQLQGLAELGDRLVHGVVE